MTPIELSRLADQLLRTVPRDPTRPHYTEESFRCKMLNARRREGRLMLPPQPESQLYLLRREWAHVFVEANLTCRQKEVVGYRMAGKTFEEIGAISGTSKQAVLNVLKQACKKILRIQAQYPYNGLAEVYRDEMLRGRRTDYKGKLVR